MSTRARTQGEFVCAATLGIVGVILVSALAFAAYSPVFAGGHFEDFDVRVSASCVAKPLGVCSGEKARNRLTTTLGRKINSALFLRLPFASSDSSGPSSHSTS
jgi:hypothetical protein